MIERIAIVLLGLAIAAAAGVIIWAVRRGNQKRARLAAVYDERGEDTEPVELPPAPAVAQYDRATLTVGGRSIDISEVRVRPIPPAQLPPRPAVRRVPGYMSEPLRPAYSSRPSDILYADPVPLVSSDEPTSPSLFRADDPAPAPAADDGFKGGGGEFGGGGASGGWDGGGSSDTGSSSGGNEAA